jgi:RNA polymerase sigma-70 factor (ECF subfamily)
MTDETPPDVTALLAALRRGDAAEGDSAAAAARDRLLKVLYSELHRIAAGRMRKERNGHTLQTTGLVNEVFVWLLKNKGIDGKNRKAFFAFVGRLMRNVLVDYARKRNAHKRGGENLFVSLGDIDAPGVERGIDLIALDEALSRLEQIDLRASRVLELRFFGGMTVPETAEAMDISPSMVKRDWRFAKAWLLDQLKSSARAAR